MVSRKGNPLRIDDKIDGTIVRALRHDRGLTLEALAAAADLNISTLVRIEGGRLRSSRPGTARRLAAALGTRRSAILADPAARAAAEQAERLAEPEAAIA
jgi:transcriptional regulator with XRE-family HTH domain